MTTKNTKKKKNTPTADDVDLLKSEVASFASSLGLAASLPYSTSGFDDSDFRKTGPIKPPKPPISTKTPSHPPDRRNPTGKVEDRKAPKPKKSPFEHLDPLPSLKGSHHPKLPLVKASALSGPWYVEALEIETRVLGKQAAGNALPQQSLEELKAVVDEKRELGERLLQQFAAEYHINRKKNGDMRMVDSALRTGTTADRVSALTCLIEDNPVTNLKAIDSLLHMVTTKVGKRYAFASFDSLKELFEVRLLPDRKLKSLLQHQLSSLPESKDGYSLLLFWYWEECLKQRYEKFVIALEDASKDMLPNLKDKAVKLIFALLVSKPEQERKLLSALVNKLGDPVRKSASGAGYHLSCLLSKHPNMKEVVINEVDSFIFRPHVGLRAKYHAVNFLSQIFLSKSGAGRKLAKKLIDVYFALFKVLISDSSDGKRIPKNSKLAKLDKWSKPNKTNNSKNKPWGRSGRHPSESTVEMDSRLLSALLTGVNRAFPYVDSEEVDDLVEVHTPVLFKLVHSNNFNVGVQALMLLYQISSRNQVASDRFYRALYSKLLMPSAINSSKPEMFLGLLVKAMKNDLNIKRIAAFSKRILQVSLLQPPQYACGCLFLLSEVLKARPPLWNMMLQNESADEDVEHFKDVLEDEPDCAPVPSSSDKLRDSSQDKKNGTESSVQKVDGLAVQSSEACKTDKDRVKMNCDGVQNPQSDSNVLLPAGYDPRHREPSFCNADHVSCWELVLLASHVHPSVAAMARTLLSGANIVYNGDPLNDLSLVSFIGKFMDKKPKTKNLQDMEDGAWHGGSKIAPPRKLQMTNHLVGDDLLQLDEEDVAPEDLVFHKFYMKKSSLGKKLKKKKKKSLEGDEADNDLVVDGGEESENDEEIDDMLDLEPLEQQDVEEEYSYDELDKVAGDDDDELLGSGGAEDMDDSAADLSDEGDGEADIGLVGEEFDMNESGDDFEDEDRGGKPSKVENKKRKAERRTKASPFASLEDYEHLLGDESSNKKHKSNKKKGRSM